MKFIFLILLAFIHQNSFSSESDINKIWCLSIGGEIEYRTKDGTYVDCLTKQLAIEVDYDNKWKESIGQALHYAESTKKEPGILLIKRSISKKDYHEELLRVVNSYNLNIKIFVVHESELLIKQRSTYE
tara:strand:- start:672 stop:1058 length:387 start_codon:yes stop_codon:yes gene_type:complete